MSRATRRLQWALSVLLTLGFCSCDSTDAADKNTNWLRPCSATGECSAAMSCRHGMCTRVCGERAECADLSPDALCEAPAITSGCSPPDVRPVPVCILPCANEDTCAPRGLTCQTGVCVVPACAADAASPPSGTPDAAGVDASPAGSGGSSRDAAGGDAEGGAGGDAIGGTGGDALGGTGGAGNATTEGVPGSGGSPPVTERDASKAGIDGGSPPAGLPDASAEGGEPSPALAYDETTMPLPGILGPWTFHAGTGALFGPLRESEFGKAGKVARVRFGAGGWAVDTVDVPDVQSLTVTPDGREVLVTTANCVLVHVNAQSLALGVIENLPVDDCRWGSLIHVMADGQTLFVANSNQGAQLLEHPGHTPIGAPTFHSAAVVVSPDRTRMIWASSPTDSGSHSIFSYAAETDTFTDFRTLASDHYTENILALSAQGKRFMHFADVYDSTFRYLGTLDSGQDPFVVTLSPNGKFAGAFRLDTNTFYVHDVSGNTGPFPTLGTASVDSVSDGAVGQTVLDDSGTVAIFSTIRHDAPGMQIASHFLVRKLPRAR